MELKYCWPWNRAKWDSLSLNELPRHKQRFFRIHSIDTFNIALYIEVPFKNFNSDQTTNF